MTDSPLMRLSRTDLESLFTALQVDFVELWECLVSPGWRLELAGTDAPGIHYNLGGAGRLIIGDRSPIDLLAHTLVIVPRGQPLRIEAPADPHEASPWRVVDSAWLASAPDKIRKFVAGNSDPHVMLICGYFHASFGASVDLFTSLTDPIVEQFDSGDRLDEPMKSAMAELVAQEVGMGAMTTALLKQVLVKASSAFVELDEFVGRTVFDPRRSTNRPCLRGDGGSARRATLGPHAGPDERPQSFGVHGTIYRCL